MHVAQDSVQLEEGKRRSSARDTCVGDPQAGCRFVGQLVSGDHSVHVFGIDVDDLQPFLWATVALGEYRLSGSPGEQLVALIALPDADFDMAQGAKVG